jgi:hypothetical protein
VKNEDEEGLMNSSVLLAAMVAASVGCSETRHDGGIASAQPPAESRTNQPSDSTNWKAVDQEMGRPGKPQPDGAYKYILPRNDLKVTVAGVTVKPALALGSWVAFHQEGGRTMAMGDLVLAERELTPVLGKLEQAGVKATALHNHLLRESPHIMYLHIAGDGDPVKIATGLHAALAVTGTPAAAPSAPASPSLGLDTNAVAKALGYAGKVNGGVYQVSVPRADAVRVDGMTIPPSMGVATAFNFQPTGGAKAAITGDFVMTADEVNPVLQALSVAGIQVNALHNHMLNEEPRLFFVHFWANDDAVKLARGLRSALDKMRVKPPGA